MKDFSSSVTYARGIILATLCMLFSIISVAFTAGIYNSRKSIPDSVTTYVPNRPLPQKYVIDDRLLSPVLNQGDRGTCWEFQIIAQLEAQYKLQGLQKGYLKDKEYLKLSHEALGIMMVQKCNQNPGHILCRSSAKGENSTTGGSLSEFIQFFTEWPDLQNSILPSSCCPYQLDPKKQMICPNLQNCLRNNPLSFTLKSHFHTSNVREAKQRLIETNIPLPFSLTMPVQRYIFPCDNDLVSESETCTRGAFKCPSNPTSLCAPHDFKLYKIIENEVIFQKTGKTVTGTPHALLLVGYNDYYVAKRNFNFSLRPTTIGGFIVKNSWGERGHTLEYLRGDITEDQEDLICPNKDDVFKWIPATYECINKTKTPASCSTDALVHRGDSIIRHSDELVCVNSTHCDTSKRYVLLRESPDSFQPSIYWSDEGVPMARVISFKDSDDPVEEIIDTLPVQHLYYAFQLKKHDFENYKGRCGYVFMPYEVIDELKRLSVGPSFGIFMVQGLDVEWKDSSYLGAGKKGDYTYLKNSTNFFSLVKPKSPTDMGFL